MKDALITIAFADDHSLVRTAIADLIHKHPLLRVVADAPNGKALIDRISALEAPPDICILDISMPVMDGYHTLTALKRTYPDMRYLILTVCDAEYSIIRMIKSGANGYLLKNCTEHELHDALLTIHEEGYYYSPLASQHLFRTVRSNKITALTEREEDFLRLCCSELQYTAIARQMNVSVRTIEHYQQTISGKLHLHSRAGLALFAMQSGLIAVHRRADAGDTAVH